MSRVGELITPNGVLVLPADAPRAQWLEARRWRGHTIGPHSLGFCIGASDVPSILDLEHVDTPAHVYRDKLMGIEKEVTEAMTWGTIFEGPIVGEWCRRNRAVIDEIGLVAHAEHPWAQATIDRRVRECPVYKDTPDGECLLEAKHMDFASASRWHEEIPDRLMAQLVFQLWVTGYSHAHYTAKVPGTMRSGIVMAEEVKDLTEYVVAEVMRFRRDALVRGVEPPWNITDKALKMVELDKRTHPDRIGELDIDGVDAVHEYAEAAARESAAKKDKERAKAKLLQLADGAEVVTFAGELAYQFRPVNRTSVDLDALRERYPAAYADPAVTRQKTSHAISIAKEYKVPTERTTK